LAGGDELADRLERAFTDGVSLLLHPGKYRLRERRRPQLHDVAWAENGLASPQTYDQHRRSVNSIGRDGDGRGRFGQAGLRVLGGGACTE
jgi:hypothetical protein